MSPWDFSLSRQDFWAARARPAHSCGIPAPESALGFHPWRALPSVQVGPFYQVISEFPTPRKCVSMIRQTLRLGAKTVKDVAGLKCQRCSRPDSQLCPRPVSRKTSGPDCGGTRRRIPLLGPKRPQGRTFAELRICAEQAVPNCQDPSCSPDPSTVRRWA
jgi:hypothetical protein